MCFEEDVTSIILNEFMNPRISFEVSVSCCISISLSLINYSIKVVQSVLVY